MKHHEKLRIFYFVFSFLLLISCSPKGGYQVLHFFFDGVPDSLQAKNNPVIDTTSFSDSLTRGMSTGFINKPDYYYHLPYYRQECSSCHDKSNKGSIIQVMSDVCNKCHQGYGKKYHYIHGPVAGGYCTECHSPHMSPYPRLLQEKGNKICQKCHNIMQSKNNPAHDDLITVECIQCHQPHGSNKKFLLKD